MRDVNLTGVFLSCQAQARVMILRGRGAVVNIASMSGSIVNRGVTQTHYNTSKAGVVHLTKNLAVEWVGQAPPSVVYWRLRPTGRRVPRWWS